MTTILDDKSQHCIPFILEHYERHRRQHESSKPPPMFVGLQGIQGAGKTTLVETLQSILSSKHNIATLVFSIDDLYCTHDDQVSMARANPSNPLVQHRGVPGTHDLELAQRVLGALAERRPDTKLPSYDKSAWNGAGDRRPEKDWKTVNAEGEPSIDLIIFEGWCVGFRSVSEEVLCEKWQAARSLYESHAADYNGELGKHELQSLQYINRALHRYDAMTDRFACFVQIDAEDTKYVYDWRLEQEAALRRKTGSGMTDEGVVKFVNGYYPAYELYTDTLRDGIFKETGKQLRLVVDKQRKVKQVMYL